MHKRVSGLFQIPSEGLWFRLWSGSTAQIAGVPHTDYVPVDGLEADIATGVR